MSYEVPTPDDYERWNHDDQPESWNGGDGEDD
jgi:hypothetical protein